MQNNELQFACSLYDIRDLTKPLRLRAPSSHKRLRAWRSRHSQGLTAGERLRLRRHPARIVRMAEERSRQIWERMLRSPHPGAIPLRTSSLASSINNIHYATGHGHRLVAPCARADQHSPWGGALQRDLQLAKHGAVQRSASYPKSSPYAQTPDKALSLDVGSPLDSRAPCRARTSRKLLPYRMRMGTGYRAGRPRRSPPLRPCRRNHTPSLRQRPRRWGTRFTRCPRQRRRRRPQRERRRRRQPPGAHRPGRRPG